MVVDAKLHSADEFSEIDRFATHSQIVLKEVGAHDRTGYAHAHRAHREVALPAHGGYSLCRAGKPQYLLGYIFRNGVVLKILYVMSVYSECRKSFL